MLLLATHPNRVKKLTFPEYCRKWRLAVDVAVDSRHLPTLGDVFHGGCRKAFEVVGGGSGWS